MDSEKYRGRYRNASARHSTWDYATPGAYFVTICTHNRHPYFGHLRDGVMKHSAIGNVASDIWYLIPDQFPHCCLDAFVVMPDHVHGVLMLIDDANTTDRARCDCRDAINRVPTITTGSSIFPTIGGITGNHNPMLGKSLSRIIRWYKGRCTHTVRKIRPDFAWQSWFHDRIICNPQELAAIRHYVQHNAAHHASNSVDVWEC